MCVCVEGWGEIPNSWKRNKRWAGEPEEPVCFLFLLFSSDPDIKRLYSQTGVELRTTSFLFVDTQIADESFLEDINNILSSGEVPNLYKTDEFEEV